MKHTEFSLRRPVTISMIFAALAAIGLISSQLLPLERWPDIEFPGFFVQIPYNATSPEEIERQITRPAEEALATLTGVKHMYSTSTENEASIWMEYGFNSNAATEAVEARVKLDSIRDQLPEDVQRILVFSGSLNDEPLMTLRISSERDLSSAYNMLDRLVKRRIERLDGVSKVELQGVDPQEIRILLDPGRIAAHNIDAVQLRELLSKSNFAVSAGQISSSGQRYSLRPNGEFRSIEEVGALVVQTPNIRLRDIAEVSLTSPERNYGRHLDGKYAIGLQVSRTTGANMVEVADRVKAEVQQIGNLPEMRGIQILDLDNQAESVRSSLGDLLKAGLLGAMLALLVLYMFLRQISTTLIVTLSVPLSLLITLGAMYFSGLSLNILTMMGLMLAVGMLVDNAVVITESIFRYRQKALVSGDDPHSATVAGVREVGLAVFASTATSICVFAPIVFGEQIDIMVFLWHVGITISVALVASLLVAQTLIPMLAVKVAPPRPVAEGGTMRRLTDRYIRALHWVLDHPRWSTLVIVLMLASVPVLIATKAVNVDMFPQEASRRMTLNYHLDDKYPVDRVEAAVNRIESYLFENKQRLDIRTVYSYFDELRGQTSVFLVDEKDATVDAQTVKRLIEDEMPLLAIGKPTFKWDTEGGGDGFSLRLSGDSTERLTELAGEVYRLLNTVDGLESITSDLTAGETELRVIVDRTRASKFNLTTEAIANTVAIAMRGEQLREFRSVDGEIRMRLAFRKSDRQTIEQLEALPVFAPDGTRLSLGSVASLEVEPGPRSISRTDRQTSINLNAAISDGAKLNEIRPAVEKLMNQLALPAGYAWSFGRSIDRNDETQSVMLVNLFLGVALIFIVMAAVFESLLYPLSIITSILFSIVGVFWFFTLTGTTFSFMAMIGIMILIGVVVNNGIVLVDHINNIRSGGLSRYDAVIEGARDRLRPILMTVCTTILGLAPLAIGDTQLGGDGPPYFPMARAIIGGLAFSTLTSLLIVPLIYVSLDRLKNWSRRAVAAGGQGAAARLTA